MEWGWNPDSVAAVASATAACAAIVAGIFAARSFRQMQIQAEQTRIQAFAATQQLRDAQAQNERAQADAIAAWTLAQTTPNGTEELCVVLQNASTTPVYDVRFAVRLGTRSRPEYRYAGMSEILAPTDAERHAIPAAPAAQVHWPAWTARRTKNRCPLVHILFRDAAGTTWSRTPDGLLEKYTEASDMPPSWMDKNGQPVIDSSR